MFLFRGFFRLKRFGRRYFKYSFRDEVGFGKKSSDRGFLRLIWVLSRVGIWGGRIFVVFRGEWGRVWRLENFSFFSCFRW